MYFTRKRSTEVLLWVLIPCLIATINATTEILEAVREGQEIAYWKPFVGEFSSVFVVLMLLPGILLIDQRWPIGSDRWPRHLMMHLPLSVFFSILHIAGMMGIRSVVYALMGEVYKFGEVGLLLIYEYRKDFVLYAVILITLYAYRELVRLRLGEAQLAAPDDSNVAEQADENRILVSKSGLFHFIDPKAIHWVEAAGNYVELHTASETYMLRATMKAIEARLEADNFARIHRSTIVNKSEIEKATPTINGDKILTLKNKSTLRLSRRYGKNLNAF